MPAGDARFVWCGLVGCLEIGVNSLKVLNDILPDPAIGDMSLKLLINFEN